MKVKFLGLQIECPKVGTVTISRPNFVVGPNSQYPKVFYKMICPCGEFHKVPLKVPSLRVSARVLAKETSK